MLPWHCGNRERIVQVAEYEEKGQKTVEVALAVTARAHRGQAASQAFQSGEFWQYGEEEETRATTGKAFA